MFENAALDDAPAEKKKKAQEVPKVEAVETSRPHRRAWKRRNAGKPVEAASEEVTQALAAEEIPVEPFKFDPSLTFSAAETTESRRSRCLFLSCFLRFYQRRASQHPRRRTMLFTEPAPLEAPVSQHAATLPWPARGSD